MPRSASTSRSSSSAAKPAATKAVESVRTRAPKGGGGLWQTERVIKAKNGREYRYPVWVAQMTATTSEGERVQVTGTGRTASEALTRRTANLSKRLSSDGSVTRKILRGVTLEEYLEEWLEQPSRTGAKLKEQTRAEHRHRVYAWMLPALSGPISEFTPALLKDFFYKQLPAAGAGPSAQVNVYKTLRAVLNGAVRDEVIPTNPILTVRPPKAPSTVQREDREKADMRIHIAPYLLQWLEQPDCPQHQHYPLVMMLMLGLRRAELLGLEWSSLSSGKEPTLRIHQQLMRQPDGAYAIQPSTKTGEDRTITLPARWKEALMMQKRRGLVAREEWAGDLMFLNEDGSVITYPQFNRIWRDCLMGYMTKDGQANEHTYWRPHGNRKLAASLLASNGVSVQVAQTILGHQSEAMAFYYATVAAAAAKTGSEAIERALQRPAEKQAAKKALQEAKKQAEAAASAARAVAALEEG